jgi:hypothetical protein
MLLHWTEPTPPPVVPDAHEEGRFYRACPRHKLELLEQVGGNKISIQLWCPGAGIEEAHVIRPHGHDRPWWWVIQRESGRRVATCNRLNVLWEDWFLDSLAAQNVGGRDDDGMSGGARAHRAEVAPAFTEGPSYRERKIEQKRRARERARAILEGRPPAEWAALQGRAGVFRPIYLRTIEKPTYHQRYQARVQAAIAGVPVPEWAKRRKPGRVEGSPWKRRSADSGDGAAA